MSKATAPNFIHVFRAGQHVTAAGEKIEFTQADLAATAAAYDPALHEAPLVIGHPKTDDPAFGWAAGFKAEGNDLFIQADQVNPEFAEMVNAGAFKKRSMKWYRPTDAANPKPGVWYPQHIGFLGANPPSIKGLRAVQFAEGADLVEVEFGEWEDRTVARLFRSLREWVIGKFGQDEADKVLNSYDIDALAEEAARESVTEAICGPAFSETNDQETHVKPEEAAALQAENARLKAESEEHARAAAATRAAAIHTAAVQFCEALIGEGKLLPAEKDTAVTLHVMAANSQPVEFGEGDGKKTDAPLPRLEALLKALPKRVEFREVAAPEGAVAAAEFAAPAGHSVDTERLDLHAKAVAHQKAHPGTDYLAAVKAVS